MKLLQIAPEIIQPLNDPDDQEFLYHLLEGMRLAGWQGRPLLVEEVVLPHSTAPAYYEAWTGSHSITAAIETGLREIPCLLMEAEESRLAFEQAGYQFYGYSSWCQAVTGAEGPTDRDRLRALERTSLATAIELLREEIKENELNGNRVSGDQSPQTSAANGN